MTFVPSSWVYNFSEEENKNIQQVNSVNMLIPYFKEYGEKIIFLNTDHGKFNSPKIFNSLENKEKIIDNINKTGAVFIMYEPLCLYSPIGDHLLVSFYHELPHTVTNIKAREIDDVLNFCKEYGIDNFEIRTCDYDHNNLLGTAYPNIKIIYDDIFLKSLKIKDQNTYSSLDKRFICSNARYSPHRNLAMAHLVDKDGFFSWPFSVGKDTIDSITWLNRNKIQYDELINRNELLNQQLFNIDFDNFKKSNVTLLKWFYAAPAFNTNINAVSEYYLKCFCAVVTETRYAQPLSNFSEKTFRPIGYRIPFILVAPPYTLVALKSLGYKTFNQWWDESYDFEEEHTARMQKIFKVIDFINSLSTNQVYEMYSDMKDTLDYNASLFYKDHS